MPRECLKAAAAAASEPESLDRRRDSDWNLNRKATDRATDAKGSLAVRV